MKVEQKRTEILDIMKGVAIILMILGHCIQHGSGKLYLTNASYFNNPVFQFIYSFHMPLFMLVSGYVFFYSMNRHTFTDNIIKKIKQLLVPILTYSIIDAIIYSIINKVPLLSAINIIDNIWFLWAVFYCSLVILFVNKFFKDHWIVYILIWLSLFFIKDIHNFHLYCFMYPYFILGYKFHQHNIASKVKDKINLILCISTILFFILLIFYNYDSYIYTTKYYILKGNWLKYLSIDIYRTIIGFAGSISISCLFYKISQRIKLKGLCIIGKYSLGIYIISNFLFIYLFPKITIYINNINYLLIGIETILVLLLSLTITFIIRKIKLLNILILGGR